jgi:hypothetical protein
METKWYDLQVACPQCDEKATNVAVKFSRSGEFRFMSTCQTCNTPYETRYPASRLFEIAREEDYAAYVENAIAEHAPVTTEPMEKKFWEARCTGKPS